MTTTNESSERSTPEECARRYRVYLQRFSATVFYVGIGALLARETLDFEPPWLEDWLSKWTFVIGGSFLLTILYFAFEGKIVAAIKRSHDTGSKAPGKHDERNT